MSACRSHVRRRSALILVWLVLLKFGPHAVVTATTTQRYRRTNEDPLFCLLSLNAVMNQDDSHDEFYSCSLLIDNEFAEGTYAIQPLPNVFEQQHKMLLERGEELFLEIWGGQVTEDEIVLSPTTSQVHILRGPPPQRRRRRLARNPSSVGSFRAVMIRIITEDAEPSFSKETLYSYLFQEDLSVKNQFERCSANLLTMEPDGTLEGVIDVRLATTTDGKTNKALMNLAETHVNNNYKDIMGGKTIRDHTDALLFVIPPGTGTWAAFATVSGKSVRVNQNSKDNSEQLKWRLTESAFFSTVNV